MKPKVNPSISGVWHIDLKPGTEEFIVSKKPVRAVRPGMLIMIEGRGFGDDPEKVKIRIGPHTLKPLPGPLFSREYAIISFPKIPPGRYKLSVSVGEYEATPVEILVEDQQTGGSIMFNGGIDDRIDRFFRAVELYLIMAEKEVKLSLELGVMPDLAESTLKTYRNLREALEELKADVAKMDDRARKNFIRALEISGAAEKLEIMAKYMKKGGISAFAHMVEQIGKGLDAVSSVLDSIKDCVPPPFNCAISLFSGGVKAANQTGKIIAQSDAYKKAMENEEEDKKWKDKVEGKLDRLEGKMDKAESKLDKLDKSVGKIEGKSDVMEKKIDGLRGALGGLSTAVQGVSSQAAMLKKDIEKLEAKSDTLTSNLSDVKDRLNEVQERIERARRRIREILDRLVTLEERLKA